MHFRDCWLHRKVTPEASWKLSLRDTFALPLQKLAITRKSASVHDMGDKSPKTKNKQAAQKQAKADAAARQKNANKAAAQVVKPKR